MKIINQSKEFTAVEKYLMTQDSGIITVNKLEDGSILSVEGFMCYEDTNSKDEEVSLMAIIGKDAFGSTAVWACQSNTFQESFLDMWDLFKDEPNGLTIKKLSGTTKAGRGYVNCGLVV